MHRRDFLTQTGILGLGATLKKSFFYPLGNIFEGPEDIVDVANFLRSSNKVERKNVRQELDSYNIGTITNNLATRSIIFRDYIDKNIYYFTLALQNKFGNRYEWFIYKTMAEKLVQVFYEMRQGDSKDTLIIPTQEMFDQLVKEKTLYQLIVYVKSHRLDVTVLENSLLSKDDYNLTEGNEHTAIKEYGCEFVPYNVVYNKLMAYGFVKVMSSYRGEAENGSSMHKFRTGLEIKKSTFLNLLKFLDAFALFAAKFGGASIVLRGAREFGHGYDKFFSHAKVNFGMPLANIPEKAYGDAHELGNCIDFKRSGRDGAILYQFIKSLLGFDPKQNVKYAITVGGAEIYIMYHGYEPMSGHFHCWMS